MINDNIFLQNEESLPENQTFFTEFQRHANNQ
jgi:hypothetical protein